MMIQNLLHTRNSELMNFLVSSSMNRIGNGMTLFLTLNNAMTKTSSLLSEGLNATFLMTAPVLSAMPRSRFLPRMMAKRSPGLDLKSALTDTLCLLISASLKRINSAASLLPHT